MVQQGGHAAKGAANETNTHGGADMSEAVIKYWPIAVAFVGFVAWLVRLEARSIGNTQEIKRLQAQRREDLEAHRAARAETNAMLAEIRDDIKAILGKPKT